MSRELINNVNIITKESKLFGKVRFAIVDGKEYAVANDVAKALGYADPKSTISKKCKGVAKIATPTNGGTQQLSYIPESDIYRLIFGSKLPNAEQFQDWVFEEVLPSIRKHGAYINENSDTVDKEYIKYARGTIKETFMNCPVENLLDEYDNAMKFYSDKNNRLSYYKNTNKTNRKYRADKKLSCNESKLEISNTIKKALNDRDKLLCDKGIIGCSRDLQATMNYISENITKINKSIKAGQLGAKTRENNKLKSATNKEPKLEDMVEIHKHPFAFNSMYVADRFGRFDRKKSDSYKSWINTFPTYEVMDMDYWIDKGVDFDLPIKLYLYFVTYEERNFDTDGLIKSAQDMIFNRCMNIDDNIVECVEAKQVGKCSSYENGKIYYYIENITD